MKIFTGLSIRDIFEVMSLAEELKLAQWSYNNYSEEASRNDSRQLLIYNEQNQLVGFLIARCYEFGEAEILNIGVRPDFQKQGIASDLLDKFLSECNKTVWLEVRESNSKAIAFYTHHGFEIRGLRRNYYYEPTENAVLMSLTRT